MCINRSTVYRADSVGAPWVKANKGLPSNKDTIFCIAASIGGDLFVGTYDDVYRSIDQGKNWVKKNIGMGRVKIEVIFPDTRGVVLAGAFELMYRSAETANTWSEGGQEKPIKYRYGLPKFRYYWKRGLIVCFGSWHYNSLDAGATWQQFSPNNSVFSYYGTEC